MIENEKRIRELKEEKYQVIFGITKRTFEAMLAIVESAYKEMRKKGGKKRKLSVLDMLIITLGYYHDYRTMENIAFDYGVHKQRISEAVAFVERALIKDGTFNGYPNKTVGKAFDDYMRNAKWESGMGSSGQRFVNVSGRIMYANRRVLQLEKFKKI